MRQSYAGQKVRLMQVAGLPELECLKVQLQPEPLRQRVILSQSQGQRLGSGEGQYGIIGIDILDHEVVAVDARVVSDVVSKNNVGQDAKDIVSFRTLAREKYIGFEALRNFRDA